MSPLNWIVGITAGYNIYLHLQNNLSLLLKLCSWHYVQTFTTVCPVSTPLPSNQYRNVPRQESGIGTNVSSICSLLIVVNVQPMTSPGGHIVLGSPLNALMSERAVQQVGSARLLDSSTHLLPSNAQTRRLRCACGLRSAFCSDLKTYRVNSRRSVIPEQATHGIDG